MITRRLQQIVALFKDLFLFIYLKNFHSPEINSEKKIFVNFENPNLYHRYFYNLLKTLKIGGYTLYYPMSWAQFRNLRNGDVYLALMFKEKDFLIIKNIQKDDSFIELSDDMFSANYYKTFFHDNKDEKSFFHIPMTFHPYMYSENLWNQPVESSGQKINSIFAFGNFDLEAYKTIDEYPFEVINRVALKTFFKEKENFVTVESKKQLLQLIENRKDRKFIFVKKHKYQIPMENVRKRLSKFQYFLCCPGVFAPLSHNFIEAMSVGNIPIIQKNYAATIYPALENNKNAIIFDDLEDLDFILSSLFDRNKEEVAKMEEHVKIYYNTYLCPKSAAKNIIKNLDKKKIFLNASERSAKLLKKLKNENTSTHL